MRKKINLLLIILIVVLSVCQLGVFGQTGNAENEPLEYFDFSIDGAISGPTATNKYYSWQGENECRPTGVNEDKIEFVFNEIRGFAETLMATYTTVLSVVKSQKLLR